jgi:hypothetical protein
MECPALYVPVEVRETGMKGAFDGVPLTVSRQDPASGQIQSLFPHRQSAWI